MMIWLLLLSNAFGQELDLRAVKDLEEKLPEEDFTHAEDFTQSPLNRKNLPPVKTVEFQKIKDSGTELGSVKGGTPLIRLSDNLPLKVPGPIFVRYYRMQDEHAFKYLVNKDGSCLYKIHENYVEPIKQELSLYEPPLRYTRAPKNIIKAEFDKSFKLLPEIGIYVGAVNGKYMVDLFNDSRASSGTSVQYAAHLMGRWDYPVKAGLALHYERTTYTLSGGGEVNYNSLNFGPIFKSKDFGIWDGAFRFQGQFRVSPFSNLSAQTQRGEYDAKFNSADLNIGIEIPAQNSWGDFVFGIFIQKQWLNLRDQSEIVKIQASNNTNDMIGMSLSQVFF